jgi:hypothetical protein
VNGTPHPPAGVPQPDVRSGLADAFAAEVTTRLPRLVDAASHLADDPEHAIREFVTDAHALASSAAVLGEDVAAFAARECEQLLSPYADRAAVPFAVAELASGAAEAVCLALSHWSVEVIPTSRAVRRAVAPS